MILIPLRDIFRQFHSIFGVGKLLPHYQLTPKYVYVCVHLSFSASELMSRGAFSVTHLGAEHWETENRVRQNTREATGSGTR